MNSLTKMLERILGRIRTQASLIQSAGLACDEYMDWEAVIASAKMIQKDAVRALELSDKITAATEADNDDQAQETPGEIQSEGGS